MTKICIQVLIDCSTTPFSEKTVTFLEVHPRFFLSQHQILGFVFTKFSKAVYLLATHFSTRFLLPVIHVYVYLEMRMSGNSRISHPYNVNANNAVPGSIDNSYNTNKDLFIFHLRLRRCYSFRRRRL